MQAAAIYLGAAAAEIAGCFAFWHWLRAGGSPLWAVAGLAALALFAWLLTLVDTPAAGRAFAAYGGVYIVAALVWMAVVERVRPDQWDLVGAALCVLGAMVIIAGPRSAG